MCLLVWVSSASPLVVPPEPSGASGATPRHAAIERVPDDSPVRAHFGTACVSYVGAHDGCGCGYNSDAFVYGELESPDEVRSLVGAMSEQERAELEADQASRERLSALVGEASRTGDVEVYACWGGDEAHAHAEICAVEASYFRSRMRPRAERTKYLVRSSGA